MRQPSALALALCFMVIGGGDCSSVVPDHDDAVSARSTGVTPIRAIQGEAHRSPMEGSTVTVEGTVSAVLERPRLNGFWLQDRGSGAERASSGVFVRTREPSELSAGDSVRVVGEVVEFERPGALPLTQIDAASVERAGEGTPMPMPVRIGAGATRIPAIVDDDRLGSYDPREDAIDFWESLEGTMIEIGDATVVGPTTRFGEFIVVPESEAEGAGRTRRGGILLQPDDENTERIIVDTSLLGDRPVVKVGDRLAGPFTGIVHYDFGNYRLMAISPPEIEEIRYEKTPLPATRDGQLTIASYNVLNLSAANDSERFEDVARSIVEDLGSPDIVALQEIQDDNGGKDDGLVSAQETLRRLAEEITAAGGPPYVWEQIDPLNNADGGAPGSNIRVAYLVNDDRLEIIKRGEGRATDEVSIEGSGDEVRLSMSPGRIGTKTACFMGEGSSDESEGTRKSLALEIRFADETWFLINNHLKSKRGDDSVFGPVQPPERRTETQRGCQAELIAGVAGEIITRDGSANVIVLGDMNEHEFRSPMRAFTDAGLVNMIERVPAEERYTYNYLGNSQVLDQVFVSPSLAERSRLVIVHVNSDIPDSAAASDHEPMLLIVSPDS